MTFCPRCGKPSATAEWIATCCPLQPIEIQEAMFGSALCVPHAISVFGIDTTRRTPAPPPRPPLRPYDGTRDEVGRY